MNPKVVLLRHTPNPEETVSMAAKLCYSPSDIESLKQAVEEKDQEMFVNKLVEMGHMSPVEHVVFTFGIEGISRACTHQLVRHRVASYSQQSQRYVKEQQFDYIIPPSIKDFGPMKLKTGSTTITMEEYFKSLMAECQEMYTFLLEQGIPAEDARFLLPNAAETKIVVTMNARELLHFFRVRTCNRAQWEIRAMAKLMLKECKAVAPIIFKKAGPGCLYSICPEGKMTCGKMIEVRKEFNV